MSDYEEVRDTAKSAMEGLDKKLDELNKVAQANEASRLARLKLDVKLRAFIERANHLAKDLDPIRWPQFVFDPGDPAIVGRFIALAMFAQPRIPLPDVDRFHGSGVYALYYRGDFPVYDPISGTETPIYVGKADPGHDTARTPLDQGNKVSNRLRDHLRTLRKAESTLAVEDFDCRFLVVQSGWQVAAEDYLINLFQPVWNSETDICFGVGKHGDAPSTRANRRSPWDTLHPGRDWAWSDPDMENARSEERILLDIQSHFSSTTIYRDVDQLLKGFLEELSQL